GYAQTGTPRNLDASLGLIAACLAHRFKIAVSGRGTALSAAGEPKTGDLGPPSARSCLPRSPFRAKRPSCLAHSVVQQGWINFGIAGLADFRLRHVIKIFRIATGMSRNLEL